MCFGHLCHRPERLVVDRESQLEVAPKDVVQFALTDAQRALLHIDGKGLEVVPNAAHIPQTPCPLPDLDRVLAAVDSSDR